MIRIGVTGHIGLDRSSRRPIRNAIVAELRKHKPIHGVTCLADGADRIFVEAVRICRGTFEAVLPVPEISAEPEEDRELRELIRYATDVTRLTVPGAPELTYEAASREVVERSDLLLAVWDGTQAGARGGTAETVAFAREQGKQVHRIWPDGARRVAVTSAVPVSA
ncbi:hypothetical protein ACWT_7027 [Actinoplanes sp. SE50]|uniref:hypothetical protein n=1 Tax=unclassified Actinoplanes TaxID=2626549 RepID=UPI00023EC523|nr:MULTISPECIES: hypothetical protein [unclassified Actinoplanes]AEV88038.1 hypothetical protein ACPL_7158 [Actinoplanes sp. SE50/110]ATO86442.1 hypothetical protein ACWT_7027 [Actinoplanes sp. SE50]SLM03857.1 hypothetical protein ACSP50_7156 [Actinoplanes sp. SE50/110]